MYLRMKGIQSQERRSSSSDQRKVKTQVTRVPRDCFHVKNEFSLLLDLTKELKIPQSKVENNNKDVSNSRMTNSAAVCSDVDSKPTLMFDLLTSEC